MKQTNLRLAALLFSLAPLSLLAPRAAAWGYNEHCAAGRIAELNLTPMARGVVERLLASAPGSGYENLGLASRWADDIKGNPDYRWANPWHYVNLPPGAAGYDAQRDTPPEGSVMVGIERFSRELADTTQTTDTRREALKFLAHFVEDVHQPLHTGHKHDRGGNDVKVTYRDRPVNLHALWDYRLTQELRPEWPEYAEQLNARITPEQKAAWGATMDPVTWVNDSYAVASSFAYQVPADGVIDEAYAGRAITIIDERISQAGYRLGLLLNDLLDPAYELPPQTETATTAATSTTATIQALGETK